MPTTKEYTLVVPELEPRLKHPTIFAYFDQMEDGESFLIQNDHDPKPLFFQLKAEREEPFTFEYLQEGPEVWLVRIQKLAGHVDNQTLGELVNQDFRLATIFSELKLDFCCGGKMTLKQACLEKQLNYSQVIAQIEKSKANPNQGHIPYQDWSLDFLADYIVQTHHNYVRKHLPTIQQLSDKLMRVHGSSHPELVVVNELVVAIRDELNPHMFKEEQILFPFIKALVLAEKTASKMEPVHFGTVQNPIHMMELEHEQVGQYFEKIRQVTENYQLPADACGSYTALFNMLQGFEEDLHIHIHLENNVLFPRSLELEKNLNSR